jgi:hypothetical protein
MNAQIHSRQKEQSFPNAAKGQCPRGCRVDRPAGVLGSKRYVWVATITRGSPLERDQDARDFVNNMFMLRDIEEGVRRGNFPSGLIFLNIVSGERRLVQGLRLVRMSPLSLALIS